MATTKVFTAIWNANALTASTADETSGVQTLDAGYGAALHIQFTNGGTGPTIPAQCQIEVSGDNTEWYDFGGPLIGTTTSSDVVSWGGIEIPIGVEYLRLVAGSNTGTDVTIDADISEVTAIDV
jgi:hypothetical protein